VSDGERIEHVLGSRWRVTGVPQQRALGLRVEVSEQGGGPALTAMVVSPTVVAMMRDPKIFAQALEGLAPAPGAARVAEARWSGGNLYYVLSAGSSHSAASHVVDGFSAVSKAEVVRIGALAADALETLHAQGRTHGALTSTDVLTGPDEEHARLLNAGVADALVAAGVPRERVPILLDARSYLSPDGLTGARATPRDDVYALGAVLYEMLTGRPPFGGRMTSHTMAVVLAETDEGPVFEAGRPAPGDGATDVVLRAIEKAPDDRWPTARDFARALRGGVAHTPPDPMATVPDRAHVKPGCLPALLAIAGTGAGLWWMV